MKWILTPGKLVFAGTVAGNEMKLKGTGTQGGPYTLVCTQQYRKARGPALPARIHGPI